MFLRFIQLIIKPDSQQFLRGFYDRIVLPDLLNSAGCLYSGLVQSHNNPQEFIFITLWETLAKSEIYEKSTAFLQFQQDIRPFLSESTEWKLQLSENLELEYSPTKAEPVFKGFQITASSRDPREQIPPDPELHLRLISLKLQQEKILEFRKLYHREIIPILQQTPGCLYAYLIEGINPEDDIISMTIWDNKKSAERYETKGVFLTLLEKVQHTFSQHYQWKLALEKESKQLLNAPNNIKVNSYGLVSVTRIPDKR